jgi:hypothetical protein
MVEDMEIRRKYYCCLYSCGVEPLTVEHSHTKTLTS